MTDFQGAISMLVNEQRVFIDQNDHKWLVVHKTAGFHTAQQVAEFFATDANEASTHYVVGQDGAIVQCVLEKDGAGGNCCLFPGHAAYLPTGVNMNKHTISIEHVDPATDNSTPVTAAQKAASFKLIADICKRHNIPMRSGDAAGGIIGHRDIDPVNRARCPGNYPWTELWAYLASGGKKKTMDIHDKALTPYFDVVADGQAQALKTKKTGITLWRGTLAYYLGSDGLATLGLPTSSEQTVDAKQFPGVVIMRFERGVVVYDVKRQLDDPPGTSGDDCYRLHIDKEPGQDPRIADLQQQLAAAQQENNTAALAAIRAAIAAALPALASAETALKSV